MLIVGIVVSAIVLILVTVLFFVNLAQQNSEGGRFEVRIEQHNSGRNPFGRQKDFKRVDYITSIDEDI